MREAIKEAKSGLLEGEVPIGAVLIDNSNRVLAKIIIGVYPSMTLLHMQKYWLSDKQQC